MADEKPIIVLKKKGGHGGHHGGAWKVAYADFVTAMMCFFMVMWLVNSADTATRKNIAQYFKRPGIFERGSGAPLLIGGAGMLDEGSAPYKKKDKKYNVGDSQLPMKKKTGPEDAKSDEQASEHGEAAKGVLEGQGDTKGYGVVEPKAGQTSPYWGTDQENSPAMTSEGDILGEGKGESQGESGREGNSEVQQLAEEIRDKIASSPELQALLGEVDVKVGADGLHIEIMDTEKISMFSLGSATVNPEASIAFEKIGAILAKLPNTVDIAGHTDARPYRQGYKGGYSNWELSADRANSARRLLEQAGIPPDRITNVLGRADRELKNPVDPLSPSNRRITLTMKFPVNEKIDLGKNPDALTTLPSVRATPPVAATPEKMQGGTRINRETFEKLKQRQREEQEKERIHSMSAEEIMKQTVLKRQKFVKLPEAPPAQTNPSYIQKDKIFGDRPVLGPPDFFGN